MTTAPVLFPSDNTHLLSHRNQTPPSLTQPMLAAAEAPSSVLFPPDNTHLLSIRNQTSAEVTR